MTDTPEPCTEEAYKQGCTCHVPFAGPTAIDPPDPKIDKWCPLHGKDPDRALEDIQDHMKRGTP